MEIGGVIALHTEGDAFLHILETHLTALFRDNHGVEGVPFADHRILGHNRAGLAVETRAVGNIRRHEYDSGVGLHNSHLGHTTHNDVDIVGVLDSTEFVDFETSFVAGGHVLDSGHVTCDTTDVERTECKLCTGLADGLGGNHAHSLSPSAPYGDSRDFGRSISRRHPFSIRR